SHHRRKVRHWTAKLIGGASSPILPHCMSLIKPLCVSYLEETRRRSDAPWFACIVSLVALAASPAEATTANATARAPCPRGVFLAFAGAAARLVQEYLAPRRPPNLARLRQQGIYSPLRSTNPPQTPVSWAAFATGLNPGRTEIFDFLRRTEGT